MASRLIFAAVFVAIVAISARGALCENDGQKDSADEKTRVLYDHYTKAIAYKDLIESKCFVELMRGDGGASAKDPEDEWPVRTLLVSGERLSKQQVWNMGGARISEFCRGYPTFLLQQRRRRPDGKGHAEEDASDNEIAGSMRRRRRRSPQQQHFFRGRVKSQTQSQYLSFGNNGQGGGGGDGRAEAESTADGSKAVVVGRNGMGSAQSQSSPDGCDGCYGNGFQEQALQVGAGLFQRRPDGVGGARAPGQIGVQAPGQPQGPHAQGPQQTLAPGSVPAHTQGPTGWGAQTPGQQQTTGTYPGGDSQRPTQWAAPGTFGQDGGHVQGQPGVQGPGQWTGPGGTSQGRPDQGGYFPGQGQRPGQPGQPGQQPGDLQRPGHHWGSPGYYPSQGQGGSGVGIQAPGQWPSTTTTGGAPGVAPGQTQGPGVAPSGSQGPGVASGQSQRPGAYGPGPQAQPGAGGYVQGQTSQPTGPPVGVASGARPGQYGDYGQSIPGLVPGSAYVQRPAVSPGDGFTQGAGYAPGGLTPGQHARDGGSFSGDLSGHYQTNVGQSGRFSGVFSGSYDSNGRRIPEAARPGIAETTATGVGYPGYPGPTQAINGVVYPIPPGVSYGQQVGAGAGAGDGTKPYPLTQPHGSHVVGYQPGAGSQVAQYGPGTGYVPGHSVVGQYVPGDASSQVGGSIPGQRYVPGQQIHQQPIPGQVGSGLPISGGQISQYGPGATGQLGQTVAGMPGQFGAIPGQTISGPAGQFDTGQAGVGPTGPLGTGQTIAGPAGQTFVGPAGQLGVGVGGQLGPGQLGVGPTGQLGHGQGIAGPTGQLGVGTTGQLGPGQGIVGPTGQLGVGTTGQLVPGQGITVSTGQLGVGPTGQLGAGQGTAGPTGQFGRGQHIPGQLGIGQAITGPSGQVGVIPTGQFGTGQPIPGSAGQLGIGQTGPGTGQAFVGPTGQPIPGSAGQLGVGQTGQFGTGQGIAGQTGQLGVGSTGQLGTGQSIPGSAGQLGVGQTGQLGTGQPIPGSAGHLGVGTTGQLGPGSTFTGPTGQLGVGATGQPGQYGPAQTPSHGPGQLITQYHPGQTGGVATQGAGVGDDADSQAQTSVQQLNNETQAAASAQGRFQGGTAQSQVSGSYFGTGSFSASAGTNDGKRGAQTQVSGGKEGATSTAQGNGGLGVSQAQVQLASETGDTTSSAQSSGLNHGTNTQVQASGKGGVADAQANGPGSTSSQAQIGFTPNNEAEETDQTVPFRGGGTASAQSGTHSGQTQSQVQGKFRYGIKYTGAAQAGSGNGLNQTKLTLPTLRPLKISTDGGQQPHRQGNANPPQQKSEAHQATTVVQQMKVSGGGEQGDGNEDDDYADDYEEDYDTEKPPSTKTSEVISQTSKTQRQHIVLDPLENIDATVQQAYGEPELPDGLVLQPGQIVPGFPGYQIPQGFRGRVSSSAGSGQTMATGRNSQAQTVALAPGTGRVIYKPPTYAVASNTQLRNGGFTYGSGYTYQPVQRQLKSGVKYPGFVSVSKSETGSRNLRTGKKTPSVYYTQSSSCGYFTNTCVFSDGVKVCTPKPKTNPDGTPVLC